MRSSARHVAPSVQSSKGSDHADAHGVPCGFVQLLIRGNDNRRIGRAPGAQRGVGALMLAVLEDGMRSYLSSADWIRAEAERWVMSPRQGSPCAFAAVCEVVGLDPHAVRAALGRLRKERATGKKTLG